jgi:RNA polymerase sigma factor (sigma-70 family)
MHSSTNTLSGALPASGPRDPRLWDGLVRCHGTRLKAVVRRALRRSSHPATDELVEDLVQEVWCRVFERCRHRLVGLAAGAEGHLTFSYLAQMARNVAVDRVRAERAAKRGGGWLRRDAADEDGDAVAELPDPAPCPEQRLLARERRRRFRQRCRPYVSRRSAGRDLAIVERALLDGWSSRQILRALDGRLSQSSVDTLVHRVRRGLAAEGVEVAPRKRGPH